MKIKYNTPEIVKDMPPQFLAFMKHLKTLNYADRPDYNFLQTLLSDLYHSIGCDDHTPFDWELTPRNNPTSSTYPLSSSQDAEYSRDAGASRPTGLHTGSNIYNNAHYSSNNASPMRVPSPPLMLRDGDEGSPSPERSVHSQHDNSPRDRRDTGSAAAAAPSSEKEHTGSWNQKSSPREKGHASDKPHNNDSSTTPADVQIKIADKENNTPGSLRGSTNAPGPSQTPPKDAVQSKSCCQKCIIM